ncbi:GvpL/GvpF family gas vesicle protein [Actinomadura barringtoniae]|uniref:GvpL/GvpF family gas vesicle protein n=1 Tax=Actinomadura barringtoniae TaxID=1427535 RepID=A0A939PJ13_9ACTN|nr:GvpL/GvpF family gas vesicle protein [Actinomadura barringtoniae]MBO2450719.1 GvpL/GvpF family gas vesicle protein [Actinomadura barringtoniae]
MTAPLYIYGVARAGTDVPGDAKGLDGHPVELVAHGDVAAVVSELPAGRPLGERADLMAYQQVLEALLVAGAVVLPFRFGAALNSREAVEQELLAGNAGRFKEILDQLEGRLEMRLKGTYVQENVLREVMQQEPAIAELNERVRDVPPDAADAAYYDRVRLGELIAQALDARREGDARALLEPLAPAAVAVSAKTPAREEDVVDAAFLIDRAKQDDFVQAVEELGQAHAGRIQLRLIGPLPPYDFVPEG